MASLAELCPELPRSSLTHLQRLMRGWGVLADISFADLLLFVPRTNAAGALQEWIAVGHVRPMTAQSIYRTDTVGSSVPAGRRPLLDLAYETGVIVDGGMIQQPAAARVRVLNVPVLSDGEVIAVVSRDFSPDHQREPGELETNYFVTFRRLAQMIAEGAFPYPVDETEVEEAPRVSDGMLLLDASARVQFASPNAVSALSRIGIYGDIEGLKLVDIGLEQRAIRLVFHTRLPHTEEIDRGANALVLRCLPFLESGEITGAFALIRDVSELRIRDRLLMSKDATIAEIHHRVKNNLQTISSLLRLQARRLVEPEARLALEESVRRVRSIAVVHEILSQEVSDDIAFADIVKPLVRMVEEGLSSPERPLSFRVEGDAGVLPSEIATGLAVVLTELLQNAADHAFRGSSGPGDVAIAFTTDDDVLRVRVVDDGVGVPDGFSFDDGAGLGLTIVRTLVQTELGGAIEFRRGSARAERPGTEIELTIPLPRPERRRVDEGFGAARD